jgi:BRCA1/BRCA2-containing complex subunit 3
LQASGRGGSTAVIWGASPQMRCERKKDRVEVNPELLAAASAQAEISFFWSLYTVQLSITWYSVDRE